MSQNWCAARLDRFWRDVHGGLTAFTAVTFLLMFGAAGMGVDFIRQETLRSELQGALDRGVLAAAALTQTGEGKIVVAEYLRSASGFDNSLDVDVQIDESGITRRVIGRATYDMPTYFLKVFGRRSLPVVVASQAQQTVRNLEISLVLDISTSMVIYPEDLTKDRRLVVMKQAANSFIDAMITPANRSNVSVSIIPFAGQVNGGDIGKNYFRKNARHEYNGCLEFVPGDYRHVRFPNRRSRKQMAHFQDYDWWNDPRYSSVRSMISFGWCPSNTNSVYYFSNNAQKLKAHINALTTHEATGSQYGMKWALGLLHENARALSALSVAAGMSPPSFASRPVDLGTQGTLKVVVFMSDGDTTQQIRIRDNYYVSDAWKEIWATTPAQEKEYTEGLSDTVNGMFQHRTITVETARDHFIAACQAAERAEIVVFTIGFDVVDGSVAEQDLGACATSPSHFLDVQAADLETAFRSVAASISKLRLTH